MTRASFIDMISHAPTARFDVMDQWKHITPELKWNEVEKALPTEPCINFVVVIDFGVPEGGNLHRILQYYGVGDRVENKPGSWWFNTKKTSKKKKEKTVK